MSKAMVAPVRGEMPYAGSVFRRVFVLVAACAAFCACFAEPVGTLTWNGPASGGEWNDAANWTTTSTDYTVAELLALETSYDFTGLADGAIVSNKTSNLKIGDMTIPSNAGTITLAGSQVCLMSTPVITIGGNTTLDWRLPHPHNWAGSDGTGKIVLGGSGTIVLNPPSAMTFYNREFQVCNSLKLIVGNLNFNLPMAYLVLWNSAVVQLNADIRVGRLTLGHDTCTVDLNGHTLTVAGGEKDTTSSNAYLKNLLGKFTGEGNLVFSGGDTWKLQGTSDYTGDFSLYVGGFNVTSTFTFPAGARLCANGSGVLRFGSDQTLYHLSGKGATGGVSMPDGSTLTLSGTNGVGVSSEFAGRISGYDVVKTGGDYTLTMSGVNSWTGSTHVAAGTLALKRPTWKEGLVANWTFDDPDDLGRDFGPNGLDLTELYTSNAVATQRLDGVDARPALHLRTGDGVSGSYFSVGSLTRARGFPTGGDAISCSFWARPDVSSLYSSQECYIFRLGDWGGNGTQIAVWYNKSSRNITTCLVNWSTSDTANSPVFKPGDFEDGKWHHIAVTYDSNALQVWYDGVLKKSTTTTYDLNLPSSATLRIGNDDTGHPNHRFVGGVDEVRIWNRALTADDVAYEYANGRPAADPAELLPDPICHWAFDDSADVGKDSQGGASLVANIGSPEAIAREGAYGTVLKYSSMKLAQADLPSSFPSGTAPFSVSVRFQPGAPYENRAVLFWGDTSIASNAFRLLFTSCPRRLAVTCGNVTRKTFTWSDNFSCNKDSWTHAVVTVDPERNLMQLFRDGVLESTVSDFKANLSPGDFILNAEPGATAPSGPLFDDVRIYDRALTPYEVVVLSQSLEKGAMGPVIPSVSDVTVDASATLKVEGEGHCVKSLAGAGGVFINGPSSLAVGAPGAFSGTVSGTGRLVLTNQMASATISSNVEIPSGAVISATDAGGGLPLASTTGALLLPSSGTVRFSSTPKSGRYVIASGASAVAADGIDGWATNVNPEFCKTAFAVEDGAFVVYANRLGMTIIIR